MINDDVDDGADGRKEIPGQENQREACFRGRNNGGVKTALKRRSRHYGSPSTKREVKKCVAIVK